MTRILAQLSVRRGPEALAFYARAFGAVVDYKVGDESIVAQLSVGDATFWVADESPEHGNFSPETLGGGTVRMLLLADDPDAALARAVAAGATEVSPVSDEYGWRLGRVRDPFGHDWEVGKALIPWAPPRRRGGGDKKATDSVAAHGSLKRSTSLPASRHARVLYASSSRVRGRS